MNNLDFNLSPPDISPAIKLHRFFLSSFVGFWLRSTPGPERIQRHYIVILSTISVFGIFGLPCLIRVSLQDLKIVLFQSTNILVISRLGISYSADIPIISRPGSEFPLSGVLSNKPLPLPLPLHTFQRLTSDQTAKSGGGSLPTHIEKFYETIGLEVQNGYGLIETSPCVAGRQPYYNVYNSLFRSVFEIYRYGSVCFFLVAFSEADFRFRHHCFVSCFKSIDLDLFVLFVCFLCTFSSGIQKRISSSPNAIKLIVFSFIRVSLAYTELKRIYEGFLFSYSKSHCYVPLKLWISVWASVLAFGPVPSLVYGLLGFYPAWRLSDPFCKCTEEKEVLALLSKLDLDNIHFTDSPPEDAKQSVHLIASEGLEAYLPLADMVDISAEVQRLTKRLSKMQTEYEGLKARLNSPKFIEKAPKDVVRGVQEKAAEAE